MSTILTSGTRTACQTPIPDKTSAAVSKTAFTRFGENGGFRVLLILLQRRITKENMSFKRKKTASKKKEPNSHPIKMSKPVGNSGEAILPKTIRPMKWYWESRTMKIPAIHLTDAFHRRGGTSLRAT